MHKTIKRFGMEGTISDAAIPQSRENFEFLLTQRMRDEGFVPVLGLGPYWSTAYNESKDEYDFTLSIYGTYVGRKRSWEVEGISTEGKTLPYTQQNKSKQSSTKLE